MSKKYSIQVEKLADKQLKWLSKKDKPLLKKIKAKIFLLQEDPKTGHASIKQLIGTKRPVYSIRVDKKNRIVYEIKDGKLIIVLLRVFGHYADH